MTYSGSKSAQDHVEASAALIERQRMLIDELRVTGHAELADRAERLLEQLVAAQGRHIEHLETLLAEARHKS